MEEKESLNNPIDEVYFLIKLIKEAAISLEKDYGINDNVLSRSLLLLEQKYSDIFTH